MDTETVGLQVDMVVMASNFTAEKDAKSCPENKDDGRSGKNLNLIEEKLGEDIDFNCHFILYELY